jgi:hypothetical protein
MKKESTIFHPCYCIIFFVHCVNGVYSESEHFTTTGGKCIMTQLLSNFVENCLQID